MPVSLMACANTIGFAMNESIDQPAPASPSSSSESGGERVTSRPASRAVGPNPWLIVALLALGLAAWQWIETRSRLSDTQQEMARRLSESDAVVKESRVLSRLAQEQLAVLQGKLGELEGKIAESKSQQTTLENLYQDLARNRDEWMLTEIEQSVTLAAQQLQLAGNVQGAVLALQAAEARLAGNSQPQFIGLRKVLIRDLDKLRALPQIDLPGMNLRLESVIAGVDALPLAVDVRPRAGGGTGEGAKDSPASLETLAFWQHLLSEFWQDVRGLIRIQRFDREEPALLAPGQDFFLRENLKLRLLNARLALLSRDQWTFRNDLKQAQSWVDRYFDGREKTVLTAREALKQLSASEISIELSNLNESLSAVKNFKLGKERK